MTNPGASFAPARVLRAIRRRSSRGGGGFYEPFNHLPQYSTEHVSQRTQPFGDAIRSGEWRHLGVPFVSSGCHTPSLHRDMSPMPAISSRNLAAFAHEDAGLMRAVVTEMVRWREALHGWSRERAIDETARELWISRRRVRQIWAGEVTRIWSDELRRATDVHKRFWRYEDARRKHALWVERALCEEQGVPELNDP